MHAPLEHLTQWLLTHSNDGSGFATHDAGGEPYRLALEAFTDLGSSPAVPGARRLVIEGIFREIPVEGHPTATETTPAGPAVALDLLALDAARTKAWVSCHPRAEACWRGLRLRLDKDYPTPYQPMEATPQPQAPGAVGLAASPPEHETPGVPVGKWQRKPIAGEIRVPSRSSDLDRWRTLWTFMKVDMPKGASAARIRTALTRVGAIEDILPAERTIQDIVRAGRAGLLEPP